MDPAQISIAILMVGAAASLLVWLRSDMAAGSARRMTALMKRVGLDPGPGTFAGMRTAAIKKVMLRRCRRCPREGLCERWLAGEVGGDNSFCPNARTFRILKGAGGRS